MINIKVLDSYFVQYFFSFDGSISLVYVGFWKKMMKYLSIYDKIKLRKREEFLNDG